MIISNPGIAAIASRRRRLREPWFVNRIVSKGRSLSELAYKRSVVRIFVANQPAVLSPPAGLSVVKEESHASSGPLYDLMRRAAHWQDEEIARRRASGDVCFAAYDGSRCIHYSWITSTTRFLEEAGCTAYLTPPNYWVYNCYTTPEYRGRSVYPFVLAHIVASVQTPSGGRVWIDVLEHNASGLRAISKVGFIEVAAVERRVALSRLTVSRRVTVVDRTLAQILATFGPDWTGAAS